MVNIGPFKIRGVRYLNRVRDVSGGSGFAGTQWLPVLPALTVVLTLAPLIIAVVARAPAPVSVPPQFAALTPIGQYWYHGENELHVYLLALFFGMFMSAFAACVRLRQPVPAAVRNDAANL